MVKSFRASESETAPGLPRITPGVEIVFRREHRKGGIAMYGLYCLIANRELTIDEAIISIVVNELV